MSGLALFGYLIDLLAVLLLALGLKGLSKVRSARSANGLAALAMGLAVVGLLIQLAPSPVAWLWIAWVPPRRPAGFDHRPPGR